MKQVKAKEAAHYEDATRKTVLKRKRKASASKREAEHEAVTGGDEEKTEERAAQLPDLELTQLEQELKLKEALYLSSLSKECHSLRRQVEEQLDKHLRVIGVAPVRGNARQRQIREMSWSFLSLEEGYPKGFELLPCALNGSEVYQFTHLVNALCLTLQGEAVTQQEECPLTPLVTRTEDKMQALEARRVLYTFLLAQVPREATESVRKPRGVQQAERGPTLQDVYTLLKEVKELLCSLKGGRKC